MSLTERQLWTQSWEFAMRLDVEALGGFKAVAAEMWPSLDPDKGQVKLAQCLNENRPEKLSQGEIFWLLRRAREGGAFNGMTWIVRRAGYLAPVLADIEGEERKLEHEIAHGIADLSARFQQLQEMSKLQQDPGARPACAPQLTLAR